MQTDFKTLSPSDPAVDYHPLPLERVAAVSSETFGYLSDHTGQWLGF